MMVQAWIGDCFLAAVVFSWYNRQFLVNLFLFEEAGWVMVQAWPGDCCLWLQLFSPGTTGNP
jgi:hypothetical protein